MAGKGGRRQWYGMYVVVWHCWWFAYFVQCGTVGMVWCGGVVMELLVWLSCLYGGYGMEKVWNCLFGKMYMDGVGMVGIVHGT